MRLRCDRSRLNNSCHGYELSDKNRIYGHVAPISNWVLLLTETNWGWLKYWYLCWDIHYAMILNIYKNIFITNCLSIIGRLADNIVAEKMSLINGLLYSAIEIRQYSFIYPITITAKYTVWLNRILTHTYAHISLSWFK